MIKGWLNMVRHPVQFALFFLFFLAVREFSGQGVHSRTFGYIILLYFAIIIFNLPVESDFFRTVIIPFCTTLFLIILVLFPLPFNSIALELGPVPEANMYLFRQQFVSKNKEDNLIQNYHGRIVDKETITAKSPFPMGTDIKKISFYFGGANHTYTIHKVCYNTAIGFWQQPLKCYDDKTGLSNILGTIRSANKIEYIDGTFKLSSRIRTYPKLDVWFKNDIIRDEIPNPRVQFVKIIWFAIFAIVTAACYTVFKIQKHG